MGDLADEMRRLRGGARSTAPAAPEQASLADEMRSLRGPSDSLLGDAGARPDLSFQVPGLVQTAEEAGPALSMGPEREAYQRLRELPQESKARALGELQKSMVNIRAGRKALGKSIAPVRMAGGQEDSEKIVGLLRDVYSGSPALQEGASYAKKALDFLDPVKPAAKGALALLDLPHEYLIRQNTTPGVPWLPGRLIRGQPIERIDDQKWNDALRKDYQERGYGFGMRGVTAATEAVGKVGGILPGLAYGGLLAAADARSGRPVPEGQWSRAIGKGQDWAAGLARTTVTDPLNLLTGEAGGAAKGAAGVMERVALRAGKTADEAERIGQMTAKILQTVGGTGDAPKAILSIAEDTGLGADVVRQAFGKDLQFLGRGQAHLLGMPVSKLTGTEYPVGKAIDQITGALGKEKSVFDQTKNYARVVGRQARARATIGATENTQKLAKAAESFAPIGPQGLEDLATQHFEPMMGPSKLPVERMTPEQQTARAAIKDFTSGVRERVQQAGGDVGYAANPISNEFFPRRYKDQLGFMQEAASRETGGYRGGGLGIAKARGEKGGLALEAADRLGIKHHGALDALHMYAKQGGVDEGRAFMKSEMVRQFGVPLKPGESVSGLERGWVQIEHAGQSYKIPAEAANVMADTFNPTLTSVGSWLKTTRLSRTGPGRAVIGLLDAYQHLASNTWKTNVLTNRPGFHVVNTANDLMKAAGDGMTDPRWLKKGFEAMGAHRNPGRLIQVGNRSYTAAELLALAQKEHIGLGAIGREDMIFQHGGGRSLREIKAKANPTLRRRAWAAKDKVNPMHSIERFTGEPIRMAHFLWGLSKGESPAAAAARTMSVLIDYGERGPKLQVARWILPFATFLAKEPGAVAGIVARHPGRVMTMDRAIRSLGANDMEPRSYVSGRGENIVLGEEPSKALAEVAGWKHQPGYRTSISTRNPAVEALQPAVQLARSIQTRDAMPLAQQLGPGLRMGLELALKKDITDPNAPPVQGVSLAPFPSGTGLGTTWEAAPGYTSIPSKYLAGMVPILGIPDVMLSVNEAIRRRGGNATTFGSQRQYTTAFDPASQYQRQRFNMWTGSQAAEVSPMDFLYNQARSPSIDDLIKAQQRMQQGLELRFAPRR